ncbi:MAG: response regulator transcription factor [Alphaproteobacteria bacterium]
MLEEKKLILCVEDKNELRKDLIDEFRSNGYLAIEAKNGEEAIKILESVIPDIIVSDLKMPIMDGYELIEKIRARKDSIASIPVIFLSAYSDRHLILRGFEKGIEDYICKPIDFDILIAKIKAILKRAGKNVNLSDN